MAAHRTPAPPVTTTVAEAGLIASFKTVTPTLARPGTGRTLYLLDEPEAPLSPIRQLALISAIKEMVTHNGQFIIATHSPILMAFPGATLLNFDGGEIRPARYEDLEHVRLMRDFLQDPEAFLRNL